MIKLLGKNPNSVIGLDIGEHTIKAVQVTKSGSQVSLDGYGSIENNSLDLNSSITLRPVLKHLFQNPTHGRFNSSNAVVSLPNQISSTSILDIPKTKNLRSKPESYIQSFIQNKYGSNRDISYSYFPVNINQLADKSIKNTYLVVTTAKELTSSIDSSLLQNGVKSTTYSSMLNVALKNHKPHAEVLNLIDIGHKTSTYLFAYKDAVLFNKINFGADQLMLSVAKDLQINRIQQVVELIKKSGLYGDEFANKARHSIERSASGFIHELKQLIDNYNLALVGSKPQDTTITICGAISGVAGFTEFMSSSLGIKTDIIKPWQNTDIYPLKPLSSNKLALFGTAIGLSLSLY